MKLDLAFFLAMGGFGATVALLYVRLYGGMLFPKEPMPSRWWIAASAATAISGILLRVATT
jgi:hypothetical protein